MGTDVYIADIRGFETWHKELDSALDIALGEENWETELEESMVEKIRPIREAILALPGGDKIYGIFSDLTCACPPLAVGWPKSKFKDATPENVEKLKKILTDAGFTVEPIESDRFGYVG